MIELLISLEGVGVLTTLLGTLVVLLLIPSKLSRSSQHSCATSFTSASESNFKSQKNVAGIRDIFNNNDINKNNNGIPNHSLDQTEEALEKSAKRSSSSSSLSISKGPPPGPVPWPVIGSLHLMANYSQVPFEGFSAISKTYGDIFSITLGSTPCVIIKTFPHFKEVLITKGAHFGGRPNFLRYDFLFGGSRDNSLALCDWSDLQKARRSLARPFTHPRVTSMQIDMLSSVLTAESDFMTLELSLQANVAQSKPINLKPILMTACANVFTQYMCSTRFGYNDTDFQKTVRLFDEIFWEINQGYAIDFMPWLLPIYRRHMKKLNRWGQVIRGFILKYIIEEHIQSIDMKNLRDFTDALLFHMINENQDQQGKAALTRNQVLYELEDFLGGHSAVGNMLMRAVGELCNNPDVMKQVQEEIQQTTGGQRPVVLEDRPMMPYTESVLLETLRLSSSPIVPHVANQDTTIAGYDISEGTMVILNNYEVNFSPDLWEKPLDFNPRRFIRNGKVFKPEHFIPFSTGKRACMGYRLVQHVSFVLLATLLQSFDVSSPNMEYVHLPKVCIAVPPDTFQVILTPRLSHQ